MIVGGCVVGVRVVVVICVMFVYTDVAAGGVGVCDGGVAIVAVTDGGVIGFVVCADVFVGDVGVGAVSYYVGFVVLWCCRYCCCWLC